MADIIDFNARKKLKEQPPSREGKASTIQVMTSPTMDIAADAIDALIYELVERGYDPLASEEMISDLGVILNCVYSMLLRNDGQYHVLHHYMTEMDQYLSDLQRLINAQKEGKEIFPKNED